MARWAGETPASPRETRARKSTCSSGEMASVLPSQNRSSPPEVSWFPYAKAASHRRIRASPTRVASSRKYQTIELGSAVARS